MAKGKTAGEAFQNVKTSALAPLTVDDFIGTMVRKAGDAEWGADPTPVAWSQRGVDRLALVASRHTALVGNPHYHPASEVRDALDLGGYIEGKQD